MRLLVAGAGARIHRGGSGDPDMRVVVQSVMREVETVALRLGVRPAISVELGLPMFHGRTWYDCAKLLSRNMAGGVAALHAGVRE
jgi:hypothetical protein